MPSLDALYPGDALSLAAYPNLKQIIQSGHSQIRGVLKYKDTMVYANPKLSGFALPQNDVSANLFECYRGGKKVSTYTSGQIAEKSAGLWDSSFSKSSGDVTDDHLFNYEVVGGQACKPVFMSLDLESPLAFACFLANSSNQRKVFIPSTFNMSKILKSINAQCSVDLVCDKEFFEMKAPGPVAEQFKEMCATVKTVTVAGEGSSASSSIFSAKSTVLDPYNF